MLQIGLPLSALVALAVLVFPLRLLTRAWRAARSGAPPESCFSGIPLRRE
jgi:hypothetical protein